MSLLCVLLLTCAVISTLGIGVLWKCIGQGRMNVGGRGGVIWLGTVEVALARISVSS